MLKSEVGIIFSPISPRDMALAKKNARLLAVHVFNIWVDFVLVVGTPRPWTLSHIVCCTSYPQDLIIVPLSADGLVELRMRDSYC